MDLAFQLRERARQSAAILLTGPEGPDGDSIGACLALQAGFHAILPEVRVDVAGSPGFRYGFLPGAGEMIPDAALRGIYDGVIVLDGDRTRLSGPVARTWAQARWTGLVDHHRSTAASGYDWAYFDADCESTCVMVREILRAWGVPLTPEIAAQLYCGLIFDTGAFRYSNTRASSHLLAAELLSTGFDHANLTLKVLVERRRAGFALLARMMGGTRFSADGRLAVASFPLALASELGATEADIEGVVDLIQHTEGVEVAVVMVERGPARVKISMRSRGRVDVAALARQLDAGGGGHAKAAGCVLPLGLEAAAARLEPVVLAALG